MIHQRMRDYELVMVISPEADEEQAAVAVERVTDFVAERGGSVSEQQDWGVRRLAYPIQRFLEGNYVLMRFMLDAKDVTELGRALNASQELLRHLVTKMNKESVKPRPVGARRGEPPEEEDDGRTE